MSSSYPQILDQFQQEERQRLLFLASTFVVLCCAVGAVSTDSGRLTMLLLSIGSLGTCCLLVMAMAHLAPALLLPRLILASYGLQCFWLVFVALFDIGVTSETVLVPEMYQHPYLAVLPNLVVPFAALAVVGLWRLLPVRVVNRSNLWQLTGQAPSELGIYLVLSAFLVLLYWPAAQEDAGSWAYLVRVLQHATGFVPLLMGRYARQFPRTNRLWLVVLAINAVIGLSVGGRAVALIPVGLYLIGLALGKKDKERLRFLVVLGFLTLPAFAISGALGAVRGDLGRGDISLFSVDRMVETANAVWGHIATNASNIFSDETMLNGPGRMVAWPNLSAAILTPESIPYRGFDGFGREILISFQISALTGSSRQDSYDVGLSSSPASLYGYEVDLGTSVEWGLLADGWSRRGPWATFLFGFVLALFFTTIEYVLLSRSTQSSRVILIFGVLVISSVMYPATSTLLYILRQSLLDCGMLLAVSFIAEPLNRRFLAVVRNHPPNNDSGMLGQLP